MSTNSTKGAIDVVVRCKNEMPFTSRTLEALREQTPQLGEIVFIDSGSKDGSRECAVEFGCTVVDILPSEYVPGRVINQGMTATKSAQVAFVNADAIPLHKDAVKRLVKPLRENRDLAATFGRQVARPSAADMTVSDMTRAFGEHATVTTARSAFFSMAASAVSREIWTEHRFSETLKYSEDVDWTYRCTRLGYGIEYIPSARFEHSHDYEPSASRKRHYGEGAADTAIFDLGPPRIFNDFARPFFGNLLRDLRAGNLNARNLTTRYQQASGYYAGRKESSVK